MVHCILTGRCAFRIERDATVKMGYEEMPWREKKKQAAAAGRMKKPLTCFHIAGLQDRKLVQSKGTTSTADKDMVENIGLSRCTLWRAGVVGRDCAEKFTAIRSTLLTKLLIDGINVPVVRQHYYSMGIV